MVGKPAWLGSSPPLSAEVIGNQYVMRSLSEILNESLAEWLSTTQIFEMAYSRESYLRNISGLVPQIVENWCLVKYCYMYDTENYNIMHWSKELITHMENLRVQKLKGNLNKLRITKQALIEYAELTDPYTVLDIIENKWVDENLPMHLMNDVAREFVNSVETLCKLISNGSNGDIRNYVYKNI